MKEPFKPLKITFYLSTPLALTYPWIFFDGLIAHLYWRKHSPELYRALPSKVVAKKIGDIIPDLPLKRFGPIFHASVSFFDVEGKYVTFIYKKFFGRKLPLEKMRRRKIDKARGFFREWRISLVTVPARKVVFYCNGRAGEIEELLRGLPTLGKKGAAGFGFIKKFSIEELGEDCSIVKDGVAMRSIPLSMVEWSSEVVAMAYKPPYWAKENVTLCAPPGAHVRLKGSGKADEKILQTVGGN